ncbi:MAG TPA: hypothetical protein VMP08_03735 [Anaerolineae bacterium]|nr:hypothetical protein [Anaerolineae bacterium]
MSVEHLTDRFSIRSSLLDFAIFSGPVLLTPEALYFGLTKRHNLKPSGTQHYEAEALDQALNKRGDDLLSTTEGIASLKDLPLEVQSDPAWASSSPDQNVIIVPYSAVQKLVISRLYAIQVKTAARAFELTTGLFSFGRIRDAFKRAGWLNLA